jgi:hypothetical protein
MGQQPNSGGRSVDPFTESDPTTRKLIQQWLGDFGKPENGRDLFAGASGSPENPWMAEMFKSASTAGTGNLYSSPSPAAPYTPVVIPGAGDAPPAPAPAPTPKSPATPVNPQYGQPSTPTTPSTPTAPSTPAPGWNATPNARTLLRGFPHVEVNNFDSVAKMRTQRNHRTGPGVSSADLGFGWVYDAPADTQRKYWVKGSTGREPGGQKKGESGWVLFQNRMKQLQKQGMSYDQALANSMQWFTEKSGGDPSRFGFRRA